MSETDRSAVLEYLDAYLSMLTAQKQVEAMLETASGMLKVLALDWRQASVDGCGVAYNGEAHLPKRLDAENWPPIATIARTIFNWHNARRLAEQLWKRVPGPLQELLPKVPTAQG